jgi:tRNA-intron endonuclease
MPAADHRPGMRGELRDGEVVVGGDARQRFHDASGYGRPLEGDSIACSRVEAAHLLMRGDLEAVVDRSDSHSMGFRAFVEDSAAASDAFPVRFLVYADLRSRGFYLSPAREGWVDAANDVDFVVYPRGKGPGDGEVAYRVRAVGERASVPATALGDRTLAVVDEESSVTYFETEAVSPSGGTEGALPEGVGADLLGDRALAWDPPEALYGALFYGQPLGDRDAASVEALQLSLLEAAYLAARGAVAVDGGYDAVVDAGRAVEGDRFDRRLRAYAALREAGVVPKTGFKFGADFRTYATVSDVEDLGHSERLVRVLPADHAFLQRDLALDVRLAHGVRKEMVFALVPAGDGDVEWLAVHRLTP